MQSPRGCPECSQFNLSEGLTFVVADRLPLFVRPIGLDIGAPHIYPDEWISLRWHMVGGFGVNF